MRLTRFVHRDGHAFGVYFVSYSNDHPETELHMLVSLGRWGEGSRSRDRVAFFCRVRMVDESYGVSLGDAKTSAWSDAKIVGKRLSREEALVHPSKATAFELLDEAFLTDPSLVGWLARARCGDVKTPLEKSFGLPDEVFALAEAERAERTKSTRSFVTLDGERHFVRCLLPCRVEGYGDFCFGIWVEISPKEHRRIRAAWNEPADYAALRFSGTLANDVSSDVELAIPAKPSVSVEVRDPESGPFVVASSDRELSVLLARTWPRDSFESYAVRRGFL